MDEGTQSQIDALVERVTAILPDESAGYLPILRAGLTQFAAHGDPPGWQRLVVNLTALCDAYEAGDMEVVRQLADEYDLTAYLTLLPGTQG